MPSTQESGDDATAPSIPEGLGTDDLVTIYSWLGRLRTFDERAVALQRQGRIGTYPLFWGEEATQAGPLFACGTRTGSFLPTSRTRSES